MQMFMRLMTGAAMAGYGLAGWAAGANAADTEVQSAQSGEPMEAQQADTSGDIIVTARRRSEVSLEVPVVVNAFSAEQLSRAAVNSIGDIATYTPQLKTFSNVGVFGGFSAIRGITSPTGNAATDPAVLVVINNVPVGTGGAMQLGQFDLGQVEVLKGPQALYFGKNATAGIIALTTAEPTDAFEMMVRGEYELRARQMQAEGVVSGPIAANLLGRLAVKVSTQEGEFTNGYRFAQQRHGPDPREVGIRGTLMFEPGADLTFKLKGTFNRIVSGGAFAGLQRVYCPNGVPAGASVTPSETDCAYDRLFYRRDFPPNTGSIVGDSLFPDNGKPYSKLNQKLLSLEATLVPFDGVMVTSTSGYYKNDASYADNNALGLPVLTSAGANDQYVLSQELRVASDNSSSSFSWMFGGFYQYNDLENIEHVLRYNPATAVFTSLPSATWDVRSRALSAFAQASLDVVDALNVSAGVRYTDDTKRQTVSLSGKFLPKIHFTDLSPELTVAYRPNSGLNIFASYKQGYKSGGFQVSSLTFLGAIADPAVTLIDNSYKPETVEGFEGGFKAAVLDRQLRLEGTLYSYLYKGLQLSALDPQTATTRISNASSARVKGAEFSASFSPRAVPGLRLFSTVAYNDARYQDFIAGCFVGQTLAQGCTIDSVDAGTVPDQQSLAGKPLMKAPKWSASTGFNLSTDVGSGLKLGLDGHLAYESPSFLTQENIPWGIHPRTYLLDAGFSIGSSSGSWEVGIVGKNLTNKRYGGHGIQAFGSGNAATTGTAIGAPSDFVAYTTRGREIRLRITLRPGA